MTITNDERREVAARLRDFEQLRNLFTESNICAFGVALGVGYMDWEHICACLADLIDPKQERTCIYVYDEESAGWRCSECGGLEPVGDHVRYCPDCGAKVVVE